MEKVAVLFARADSVYKSLPGCDVWDKERDARKWTGGTPGIFHPPCRAWAGLRHMAKPDPGEIQLTPWAVSRVRKYGGVLEHPVRSLIFSASTMPKLGEFDRWGGWTLVIDQNWWGHRAQKRTGLYICGCLPRDLPAIPLKLGEATHVISTSNRQRPTTPENLDRPKSKVYPRPRVTKAELEATPPEFAAWLVEVARRCRVDQFRAAG